MSFEHRLKKLEKSLGTGNGRCPVCQALATAISGFEIACVSHGVERLKPPSGPLCSRCGRPMTVSFSECDCGGSDLIPPEEPILEMGDSDGQQ